MLKKVVLFLAVAASTGSVAFGASSTQTLNQKMNALAKAQKALAKAESYAVVADKAALEAAVNTAREILALDSGKSINGQDYAETDDSNRADRQKAVREAEAALANAKTQTEKDSLVADAKTQLAAASTFATKAALHADKFFMFRDKAITEDDSKIQKARSAVKSAANIAALVVCAESGRKIAVALKSDAFKNAKGAKAKAVAFGKALNLSPRQSKVLYGALATAAAGHLVNKYVPASKYF